jgi:DNA-binding winged helix-turn-helix (wHTH) protein
MPFRSNRLAIKQKHLGGVLLLTAVLILCLAFSLTGGDDFDLARREVLLRRIGHEILLQSGDSVSRVLPVKKTADNEYRIAFERPFTFHPDSLVQAAKRLLASNTPWDNYVVNVLNASDGSVAYGFALSGDKKDDIIACLGRKQPTAQYELSIRFQGEPASAKNGYLLGGLALLALVGAFLLGRSNRRNPASADSPAPSTDSPTPDPESSGRFTIGSMVFDAEARKLLVGDQTVDLTKTETRVLRMFALAPNEVIERSRLQKEIWEDEGVIVGRSLDMFISKLRKKLEPDETIKLAVVRGKGYMLQVGQPEASCE